MAKLILRVPSEELTTRVYRRRFVLLGALALSTVVGCAGSSPSRVLPARIDVTALRVSAPEISVVDLRDDVARQGRVIESGGTIWLLGDDALEPRALVLVRSRLGEAIPAQFRDATIEITRLDVGYWSMAPMRLNIGPAPFVHVVGAPVGANVVGNMLGGALASALSTSVTAKAREAAIAHIEIRIAGHPISSVEVIPLQESMSLDSAIERALSSTLSSTTEKVRSMQHWERRQP